MLIETLTPAEARVLGTLLEKGLATPDYYPMTLNALRTACNQKTSRDPVSDYDDGIVSEALAGLKRKTLVTFTPYGSHPNQFKYRHFLEDVRFNLRKPDLAVLAVLLLRGAQTLNEIKVRASSLHPLDSLEAAEAVLQHLAGRPEPLAELLPKRPGWKEPRWRDTVRPEVPGMAESGAQGYEAGGDEGSGAQGIGGPGTSGTDGGTGTAGTGGLGPRLQGGRTPTEDRSLREEFEELKREVAGLREMVAGVQAAVDRLRADLG